MGNEFIDLSRPIQPIIFDPKRNEWILKERETRGIPWGDQVYLITPDVTETEYIKNGKRYYRRVEHHFDNRGKYDVVTENVELPKTGSRLPGPTNGGLDLDDRTRWMITGSPFVQFRTKDTSLDLEARLRIIFILAADKLDPATTGQAIIDMLKDPVTIVQA